MFNVKEIIESIVPSILRNCEREFCNNRYFKVRHSLSRNNTCSQPTRMYEINTPGLTLLTSKFSSPNRIEKDQKPKFEGPSFKSTTLLPDALSGCENKYIHIKGDHACFRSVFKESNRMQNSTIESNLSK